MIVGDSIGVGVSRVRKECVSTAVGGINSWQANQYDSNKKINARIVIISLGSNDHKGVKTEAELRKLRANTTADRVYWILPAIKPDIQQIVHIIAADWKDIVLPISETSDKVHPTMKSYKEIGRNAKLQED
jgi:lysophospholipase L1-like esterase